MKKIYCLLVLFAAACINISCTGEVDDIFDKSASERIEDAIKSDTEILTSAANGWVMYYYGNKNYGGYNVLCKFNKDNTVNVSSEFYDSKEVATSHYKVEQSAGVVLSFDEYNEIFHWFSDPVNPSGIGTNGQGFEGDLEFRVISATPEKIILKGKKTENKIVMVPVPSGMSWEDYFSAVESAEADMAFAQYYYVVGTDSALVTSSNRNLNYSYVDSTGTVVNAKTPYIVTPEGYVLYEDMTIFGTNTEKLTYKGGDKYEFDSPSGVAKMYGQLPPINEYLNDGTDWYATYKDAGSTCKAMWDQARVGIVNQTAFSGEFDLRYLNYQSNVLYVYISYWAYLKMKCTLIGENQVKIEYDTYGNNNASLFLSNITDFEKTYLPFVGTFTITTDNGRNPTWIRLTSNSDPNQYITLYKQAYTVY